MGGDHHFLSYIDSNEEYFAEEDIILSDYVVTSLQTKLQHVRDMLILIQDKYEIKYNILKNALGAIALSHKDVKAIDSNIINYDQMPIDWKKEYSIPQLIIKVKRAHFNQTTDTATMLKWYHEFKRKKGFKIGRRGKYKREFFLEKYSIRETSLKRFLFTVINWNIHRFYNRVVT
jgi:hypothetical protein